MEHRTYERFGDKEFETLLKWFMVSDPWPLGDGDENTIKEMLNQESKARGYNDWVVAYHEWGAGND